MMIKFRLEFKAMLIHEITLYVIQLKPGGVITNLDPCLNTYVYCVYCVFHIFNVFFFDFLFLLLLLFDLLLLLLLLSDAK